MDNSSVQIFWRRTKAKEFGIPFDRFTSHILVDGEVVEFPCAVACCFPGGATQVTLFPSDNVVKALVGPDQQFLRMTATLWLFYMLAMGDEAFSSLTLMEGVIRNPNQSEFFDSIQTFLTQEDEQKGDVDEAE